MFDSTTASLIRTTPEIDGYDQQRLPELLTQCYAQISVVRLRLARGSEETVEELREPISQLRTLAIALEIYAAMAPDNDDRQAAAFVAGTAHQLLVEASRLSGIEPQPLRLSGHAVPSELSIGLLFMAAGYPADAAEAVGRIASIAEDDHRAGLAFAVRDFCRGNLRSVLARAVSIPDGLDIEERAETELWQQILTALKVLSARFIRETEDPAVAMVEFRERLERVRRDSVRELQTPDLVLARPAISAFSGPHHLATLLLAAGHGLDSRALADVPDPEGPPANEWQGFLKQRLLRWPFLWTNHMDAIRAGLLDSGKSATISFPTGAGKSTLSELKIAATVLAGKKVIYLAPTLALVGQVSRNVREMLAEADVEEDEVDDQLFVLPEVALERAVSVMTPERCLLLLTLFPESFEDVGLIVFDECHFLHMSKESASTRPVSAMLGLLRLLEIAPGADVLLMSALMSNGEQLAGWLSKSFNKDALSFDAAWKPTRQARGSVVFGRQEILDARALIPHTQGRIPQGQLQATPHAVVSLQQTWASNSLQDYKVLRLTDLKTKLSGARFQNGDPKIDLKSSECAINIALAASDRGLKSIVFFHNPASIAPAVQAGLAYGDNAPLNLLPNEVALYRAASIELGHDDHVFLPNATAGGHYGDLLREEREIVEGAFKRADGVRVLFSTNTLAQGMNLPADLVVIVRTGAYNPEAGTYQNLEVHDLLNAAGRAGRAGHSANGLVLVIPDRIVTVNASGQVSGTGLGHLKDGILAHDDRCLDICDPIEVVLDAISTGSSIDERVTNYLLLRLPPSTQEEDAATRGRQFFAKSLAAYRARLEGQEESFAGMMNQAFVKRAQVVSADVSQSVEEMCSATGLPPSIVSEIISLMERTEEPELISALSWGIWALDLVEALPDLRGQIFRSTANLDREILKDCLRRWITGQPLRDIELACGTRADRLGFLKKARKFGRETVREISYFVGMVGQIALGTQLELREELSRSASTAAALIREGCDSRDKWALAQLKKQELWTRVRVHQEAEAWLRFVKASPGSGESTADLFRRVSAGVREYEQRSGR